MITRIVKTTTSFQKQSSRSVLLKRCPEKFCNIHKKVLTCKNEFTSQKMQQYCRFLLWILRVISEQLFWRPYGRLVLCFEGLKLWKVHHYQSEVGSYLSLWIQCHHGCDSFGKSNIEGTLMQIWKCSHIIVCT